MSQLDDLCKEINNMIASVPRFYKKRHHRQIIKHCLLSGIQNVHTPFELCDEILDKLFEYNSLARRASYLVVCNVEFVECLVCRGILPSQITFAADSELESVFVGKFYVGCTIVRLKMTGNKPEIGDGTMKFDVVVGNPPYQPPVKANGAGGGSGSRNTIWDKFVVVSLDLVNDDGFVCLVHPPKWRKPGDDLFSVLTNNRILYLEFHSKQDGIKTFGAMTPYDWYVLQKSPTVGETTIKDTAGHLTTIKLSDWEFLPNQDFELVKSLLAKDGEETAQVIFSRSMHGSDKSWMSEKQDKNHPYPCVHTTGRNGVRRWYSSQKTDMFGTPKIIFGEADIVASAIVDFAGEYGLTQQAIGLKILSQSEGQSMKRAMEGETFNNFLRTAVRWSQMRIDWRMFKYFRKDFWKAFLPDDGRITGFPDDTLTATSKQKTVK